MERASDVLMREHRGIERMLRILEVAAARVERGQGGATAVALTGRGGGD